MALNGDFLCRQTCCIQYLVGTDTGIQDKVLWDDLKEDKCLKKITKAN